MCFAGQLPAESIQASNTADEPDLRNPPPPVLCVKCSSRLRGQSARKKHVRVFSFCYVLTKLSKKILLNQCKVLINQIIPLVVFSMSRQVQLVAAASRPPPPPPALITVLSVDVFSRTETLRQVCLITFSSDTL